MNNIKYKLLVRCITYNHSQFIADAMDGFVMQKTNFPYLCCIIDDASTDGEQDVIKTYLEKNFTVISITENDDYVSYEAKHLVNANCFFLVYLLKYNHYSIHKSKDGYYPDLKEIPYCAMCEGDDYWIDRSKLQKQVNFLENHTDISSCIHAYILNLPNGSKEEIHKYQENVARIPTEDVFNSLGMFCATASWVYRSSAIKDYPKWTRGCPVGDRPLKLVLFERGGIGYLDEVMSVYRLGVPGSWTERMSVNVSYRLKNHKGMVDISRKFDEWTGQKYHSIIRKSIREQRRLYLLSDVKAIIKLLIAKVLPSNLKW